jgi:RNA polymerase sigma-70 factor (ECF subfamily)
MRTATASAADWGSGLPTAQEAPGTLVSRARGGDLDAFETLVRRHERMVFSLALHVLHDRARAEEVAQEVFLQLFRALDQIESDAHAVFWLRRVTGHRAIDAARREPVRPHVPLDAATPIAIARRDRDPWLSDALATLVAGLPPRARTVVALRYQEDLDPGEIAAVLDIPLNTVKSQLKRALAVLRGRAGALRESRE